LTEGAKGMKGAIEMAANLKNITGPIIYAAGSLKSRESSGAQADDKPEFLKFMMQYGIKA